MGVYKGADLIGLKVNKVTVLGYCGNKFYACVCECGNFCKARSGAIRRGDKVSCGCTNKGQGSTLYSQEDFIRKSKEAHGDLYDYSESFYTKSNENVLIKCRIHGGFEQIASAHMNGQGCPKCGFERSSVLRRKDKQEFISQATILHKGKFNYSLMDFVDSKTKVKIVCNDCTNVFLQSPNSHLRGNGCKFCSGKSMGDSYRSNTEAFVEKARKVHGNLYNYEIAEYVDSKTKINIICNRCENIFCQTPNKHLIGRGCPFCAKCGFKSNKSAYLYILKCEDITKIGITNNKPSDRAQMVGKSFGKKFSIIETYSFDNGSFCQNVECNALEYLKSNYKSPEEKFHGYSECFYDVDVKSLKRRIEEEINGYKEKREKASICTM